MVRPSQIDLENTLTKARDYCRRGVGGMPSGSAASAPGYILAPFDRAMVKLGGTYPQIPSEAAWYIFPFINRGSAADWGTLLIYCDPEDFVVHTYTDHWLAGFRLQAEEVADEISVDTQWHLIHVEREMKSGHLPRFEAERRLLPTGSGKTGLGDERHLGNRHAR